MTHNYTSIQMGKDKSWYRSRMFMKQAQPTVMAAERGRIRTLDWKPPAKIRLTACMLCAMRTIDAIGNQALLRKLGLHSMADAANRKLALRVGELP